MHDIYIIGASGHSKVIVDILNTQGYEVLGIFDKNPLIKQLLHFEVKLKPDSSEWPTNGNYIIAIGNNRIRKQIAEEYKNILTFGKAIHSNSIVSRYAQVSAGTVIMAGATINVDVTIDKHVIVNTNCSIDHDCILENYVHISPNVALAGNVTVEEGTHIGIGACVIQGIKIGKWATIGAGAVVINDVPDYAVVVGNPGRIIKFNKSSE